MRIKQKTNNMQANSQDCIYRTTPYQYICTSPFANSVQTVGKPLKVNVQTTLIKPQTISGKIG